MLYIWICIAATKRNKQIIYHLGVSLSWLVCEVSYWF